MRGGVNESQKALPVSWTQYDDDWAKLRARGIFQQHYLNTSATLFVDDDDDDDGLLTLPLEKNTDVFAFINIEQIIVSCMYCRYKCS